MKKIIRTPLLFILTLFNINAQNTPTDCINAIVICGNTDLELNSNGIGIDDFALPNNNLPSCGFVENQSLWLKVNIVQSGTLAFTITPESTDINEDYDFAIYGPNVSCTNLASSIRCSSTNPFFVNIPTTKGLNDIETDENEGPGELGNGFVKSINAVASEEYYILIDNYSENGGFKLEFTGTAKFSDLPINAAGSLDLNQSECDIIGDPTDGKTNFDIEINTNAIKGLQTNVNITYYNSDKNANIGNNPITSPYLSTKTNQTIYIRIENTITGCFIIETFDINTLPRPQIVTPTPFALCDNDDDGDNTNGFALFNLGDKRNEILKNLNPLNYRLTYHQSQTDADTNNAPINENIPFANTANPQTIFVRTEKINQTACYNTTQLELRVNSLPVSNPTTLIQCDVDSDPFDGIIIYNLKEANNQLTAGNTNTTVSFYTDVKHANSGNPTINKPDSFTNTITNQKLYARVTDNNTKCYNITSLELKTSTSSANDAILKECDDDGIEDGYRTFNLNKADKQILKGIITSNYSVSYYKKLKNALSEIDPITTYTNITPNTQGQDIIYARVEDNINNCYGINKVHLFLNPLPNIKEQENYFLCKNPKYMTKI